MNQFVGQFGRRDQPKTFGARNQPQRRDDPPLRIAVGVQLRALRLRRADIAAQLRLQKFARVFAADFNQRERIQRDHARPGERVKSAGGCGGGVHFRIIAN